ncbi:TPA: hypothetical protein PIW98_002022 [Klebsiella quasipneumoniae subsp. similipneumoniae]|nr:hypothetical protein [Klebsiella quasipneumoniae subsp. similipneumoniae]
MEANDIKKIQDLENDNRRLKQMFADLSLLSDIHLKSMSIRTAMTK